VIAVLFWMRVLNNIERMANRRKDSLIATLMKTRNKRKHVPKAAPQSMLPRLPLIPNPCF
jgi:hypothetical protein